MNNEYITITLDNLEDEHLCCAISDKKHQAGVLAKKEWLRNRILEGHVFYKRNVAGKVFVEYAPVETAWAPIVGKNYLYIYCLWVAGSYKGAGYGRELLNHVIEDAKGQKLDGVCLITSKKKKPYLADKKFFLTHGFQVADAIADYELLTLSFSDKETPRFTETVKEMKIDSKKLTIFYSAQCPFTANCVKEIKEYVTETGACIDIICVDTLEKAKSMPCIFTNFAVFKDGSFVSNTLQNKNMIQKLYSAE